MVRKRVGRKGNQTTSTSTSTTEFTEGKLDRLNSGGSFSTSAIPSSSLRRMTREQLKRLLRERRLPVSGNKTDMVHGHLTTIIPSLLIRTSFSFLMWRQGSYFPTGNMRSKCISSDGSLCIVYSYHTRSLILILTTRMQIVV